MGTSIGVLCGCGDVEEKSGEEAGTGPIVFVGFAPPLFVAEV